MTSAPTQVERRVGQRFPFLLPVSFRVTTSGAEGVGFTQDLSSRGVFFLTAASLREGDEIELTLTMPSEITLGESMRVRCRGRILRTLKPSDRVFRLPHEALSAESTSGSSPVAEIKIGVAVRLEGYEYLANPASASQVARVAVLHADREEDHVTSIPPQR
jgi:PilZ domain